jgi:hypothetical protein
MGGGRVNQRKIKLGVQKINQLNDPPSARGECGSGRDTSTGPGFTMAIVHRHDENKALCAYIANKQ